MGNSISFCVQDCSVGKFEKQTDLSFSSYIEDDEGSKSPINHNLSKLGMNYVYYGTEVGRALADDEMSTTPTETKTSNILTKVAITKYEIPKDDDAQDTVNHGDDSNKETDNSPGTDSDTEQSVLSDGTSPKSPNSPRPPFNRNSM